MEKLGISAHGANKPGQKLLHQFEKRIEMDKTDLYRNYKIGIYIGERDMFNGVQTTAGIAHMGDQDDVQIPINTGDEFYILNETTLPMDAGNFYNVITTREPFVTGYIPVDLIRLKDEMDYSVGRMSEEDEEDPTGSII